MTKIQEKMQLAALGVAVVALTLVFGLALILSSGPPDEGQDSQAQDLTVIPLPPVPPVSSAFDPDAGQEFGVIEGGVIDVGGNVTTTVEIIEEGTDGEEGPTGNVGE